jgi:hypothetical protein
MSSEPFDVKSTSFYCLCVRQLEGGNFAAAKCTEGILCCPLGVEDPAQLLCGPDRAVEWKRRSVAK